MFSILKKKVCKTIQAIFLKNNHTARSQILQVQKPRFLNL